MKLAHNRNLCIGCRACQQACQDYHNLPAGKKLMSIIENERMDNDKLSVIYTLHNCIQCVNGHCQQVCPTGAIIKEKHGINIILTEKCIGCGRCAEACPLNVVKIKHTDFGTKAVKCTLCIEREHNQPVCVQACPLQCLKIVS